MGEILGEFANLAEDLLKSDKINKNSAFMWGYLFFSCYFLLVVVK